MKRFALLFAMLMMVILPMTAAAAGSIEWGVKDINDDLVRISGTAGGGETVTVIVLNPGYGYDSYISDSASERRAAIKYFGHVIADDNGNWDIDNSGMLKLTESGEYTVLAAGSELKKQFYTYSDIVIAIGDFINDAANTAKISAVMEKLGFSDNTLVTGNDGYHTEITTIADEIDSSASPDLEIVKGQITEALILSAIEHDKRALVLSGDEFIYAEDMGLLSSGQPIPEYESYLYDEIKSDGTALSEAGKENVRAAVMGKSYDSLAEAKEAFKTSYLVNAVMNNKSSSYGHIDLLFSNPDFSSAYAAAFASEGKAFPPTVTSEKFTNLKNSGASTLAEIAIELSKEISVPEKTPETLSPSGDFSPSRPSGSTGGSVGGTTTPGGNTSGGNTGGFVDTETHWASEAINALVEKGVINGYDDKSYRPENSVTRAEFAKMLVTLLGLDTASANEEFADVNSADWFAPFVAAAAKAGFIMGNGGNFNPNDIISRQDTAVILARALGLTSSGQSSFADSSEIADYARDAAAAVQEADLMKGMEDGSFEPFGSLTRAQAATVLYRLLERGAN